MPTFSYRARNTEGLLITGKQEAAGIEELKRTLADHGMIPLAVKEAGGDAALHLLRKVFQQKVQPEEILILTRQFYTLFKAGLSMGEVLSTLEKQSSNKRLKDVLQRIRADISAGDSLSKAFSRHHDIFGDLYVSMLVAGEEAGILEKVLGNLSELIEKETQIKSSVKSATLYPKIVVGVLIVASVVIMTAVVPKFASFYSHYKATLPLPTRILMGVSSFLRNYWYLMGLATLAAWWGYRRFLRTARGRLKIGALRLRIPVFGPLNLKVANARFCHILSALYRSGLQMTRALEITGGTIENGAFTRDVDVLRGEVTNGKTLAEGMAGCRYFTPVIVEATAVGEKTGSLDEMLESMGGHYDLEVQHTTKNLTTLLEPFLLIAIFGMVTLFALAIFLPIWNMSRAVTGG